MFYVSPFQGLDSDKSLTQGVALGWYVMPFQGLENRVSQSMLNK
jgi:hypothetical protein